MRERGRKGGREGRTEGGPGGRGNGGIGGQREGEDTRLRTNPINTYKLED